MATEEQSLRAHLALVKTRSECSERDILLAFSKMSDVQREHTALLHEIMRRQRITWYIIAAGISLSTFIQYLLR
jgi:hypothetical protein